MKNLPGAINGMLWWLLPLVVLAALIGFETDWGSGVNKSVPTEDPVVPKPVETALLPDYQLEGGLAARTETVARTLFNPTRRAAPVAAADAAKTSIRRGQFALTGTVVVAGMNTAYLREVAGGKSRRVIQGETVNGMTVTEVRPDRVVLAQGGETEELFLKVAPGPKTTTQPAPAAGGAPAAATAAAPAQPGAAPTPVARPAAAPDSPAARRAAARAAEAAARAAAAGAAAGAATTAQDPWTEMYRQRATTDAQPQTQPQMTTRQRRQR